MMPAVADKALMIDVRTRAEARFAGFTGMHDDVSACSCSDEWKLNKAGADGSYRKIDSNDCVTAVDVFIASREKYKPVPNILVCRTGKRLPVAARNLHKPGSINACLQAEGFDRASTKQVTDINKRALYGWKNAGLAYSYHLAAEKLKLDCAPKQP